MAWIITKLCDNCKDTACVPVCPVDCIYDLTTGDAEYPKTQLWIEPDECINCGACEPECPWGAIFEDSSTPKVFEADIARNRDVFQKFPKDQFVVQQVPIRHAPTAEEIDANNAKYGYVK